MYGSGMRENSTNLPMSWRNPARKVWSRIALLSVSAWTIFFGVGGHPHAVFPELLGREIFGGHRLEFGKDAYAQHLGLDRVQTKEVDRPGRAVDAFEETEKG